MMNSLKIVYRSVISVFIGAMLLGIIYIAGCSSDNPTTTPTFIDNPNVRSYDSVGVEEDSSLASFTSIVFINGTNTTGISPDRDCSMASPPGDTTYTKFFLRSGLLLDQILDAGYDTRFFLVKADISAAAFDTMSAVYDNIGSALDTLDFTQDNTYGTPSDPWGYFTAPLTTHPVYCFWLKGRKTSTTKNIFGILQPREATDRVPGSAYGYKMSFRFRINTNGENDFRKKIQQ